MSRVRMNKTLVMLVAIYFVISSCYALVTVPWSAPGALLIAAFVFQALKLASGILLILRHRIVPMLVAAIFIWSLVGTGMGFRSHPVGEQSAYTLSYVLIYFIALGAVVLYMFYLKRVGYLRGRDSA